MNTIVDTVEHKIQNELLTAIDKTVGPKIELAIRSINASSGGDASSVAADTDRRESVRIIAAFENASENNNIQQIINRNDETGNNVPDEASELSVPETRFDGQSHTHHLVTGQLAQTNQNPEFLTGRILTPRNPPSNQNQHLSTQVSQNTNLSMVEQTP